MKLLKKWSRASSRRQGCTKMPRRPRKGQLGKVSSHAGTARQWAEDERLDKILERRRMERSSLQAEVMDKALELEVHERMSQGEILRVQKKRKSERMVY